MITSRYADVAASFCSGWPRMRVNTSSAGAGIRSSTMPLVRRYRMVQRREDRHRDDRRPRPAVPHGRHKEHQGHSRHRESPKLDPRPNFRPTTRCGRRSIHRHLGRSTGPVEVGAAAGPARDHKEIHFVLIGGTSTGDNVVIFPAAGDSDKLQRQVAEGVRLALR